MDYMQKSNISYSPMERDLLGLLPKRGKSISSSDLADKHYEGKERPYHALESITKVMSQLIEKVDHNNENFKIVKTKPSGPKHTKYSRVARG